MSQSPIRSVTRLSGKASPHPGSVAFRSAAGNTRSPETHWPFWLISLVLPSGENVVDPSVQEFCPYSAPSAAAGIGIEKTRPFTRPWPSTFAYLFRNVSESGSA